VSTCASTSGAEDREQGVSRQEQQRKYHDGLRTQQSSSDTVPHRMIAVGIGALAWKGPVPARCRGAQRVFHP
jgi:hypothetical protein